MQVYPDGDYEHGATWVNTNDRVMWERTFAVGTDEQRRIAQAAITADPNTPGDEIRLKMTMPPPPAMSAPVKVSPGLDDVLRVGAQPDSAHLYDRSPTDFSGTRAVREGSSYPSISAY
jgi:hypothetical protein